VNYDNSLVVTITVTCYLWAPSTGDHYLHVALSPGRRTCGLNRMLSFLLKRHGSVADAYMSAVPMVFGLALTLATFVLVVVLPRFNSWDQFFFPFFKSFQSLGLGIRARFRVYLLCSVHFYQAYCTRHVLLPCYKRLSNEVSNMKIHRRFCSHWL